MDLKDRVGASMIYSQPKKIASPILISLCFILKTSCCVKDCKNESITFVYFFPPEPLNSFFGKSPARIVLENRSRYPGIESSTLRVIDPFSTTVAGYETIERLAVIRIPTVKKGIRVYHESFQKRPEFHNK